jgi:hypothetical protein
MRSSDRSAPRHPITTDTAAKAPNAQAAVLREKTVEMNFFTFVPSGDFSGK